MWRMAKEIGVDKTLLKGLQVLEYVTCAGDSVRSTDVATALELQKSNVHRVLKTLEAAGFVVQDPRSKEYRATLKLWELGSAVVSRLDLRQQAAPILRALRDESGETVHLSVLEGADVVYIEKLDSMQPIGAYTRIGGRAPAYCVATGKALLSSLQPESLEPLVQDLVAHSAHTITDRQQLLQDLSASRARGYSINRGEWRDDVWGLAANVKNRDGQVIAAVGVSGPMFRLGQEGRLEQLGARVVAAAEQISEQLGYRKR